MKKFSFSLESVLNYKRHCEEILLEELARLESRLREAEVILAGLTGTQRRTRDELRDAQLNAINLPEVNLIRAFLKGLETRIEAQTEVVAELSGEVGACRERVVVARQERKTMERLKEKAFVEYQKQYWREEQLFIDEVANQSFNRRGGEAPEVGQAG